MRKDYVFTKKNGYVKRKTRKEIDYSKMASREWALLMSYFRWYPDRFYDLMESPGADFTPSLPQRATMRTMVRYMENFTTGCRGYGKTYDVIAAKAHSGVFWPGTVIRYIAPSEKQSAPIANQAWKQLKRNYPGVTAHYVEKSTDSKDHFGIETPNGSVFSTYINRGDNVTEIVAEEAGQEDKYPFNHEEFRTISLPTVRKQHMVNKLPDPTHIDFIKTYITSACRQQNPAYQIRKDIIKKMLNGESAFAIDIPWEVAVLAYMKPYEYYANLKSQLTPEEYLRECCSRYTGTSENPIVRDEKLTEAKQLKVMEDAHCGDKRAIYIIGYDVSYEDGPGNARCATAVLKCEKMGNWDKTKRYVKSLVYVSDNPPPRDNMDQAIQLKRTWAKYCTEDGAATYIAIDANQYGHAVLEGLHRAMDDGMPPLCTMSHAMPELERDGALPVVYGIRAVGGVGTLNDSDTAMIQYAEQEFEHNLVQILTTNAREGVDEYKLAHKIKDDANDYILQIPYKKTRELCEQISNLKKVPAGIGWSEKRISKGIQRDMWSAFKYALRLASILEYQEQVDENRPQGGWAQEMAHPDAWIAEGFHTRLIERSGGNGRR